jgi:glycosyltransferase involved in cell wall biosynthesis
MPAVRSVLVCEAQVPFVDGGAERLVRSLMTELRRQGYRAEKVSVPFKSYPKEELLAQAALWRLVDLTETNYEQIDLVIATKFPTYFVRHPNKVTWLMHQHRAIYDLCGTPFSEFDHSETDVNLRDRLIELDTQMLAESKRLYSISRNTATRLARYNGLAAEALYHPPTLAGQLEPGPFGDYVLSVGRLELNKRVDLIIRAVARTAKSVRLIVAGQGPQRPQLEKLASDLGVADRVTFTGQVEDRQLVDLYANARAVIFPPFDEDYGYVTLEAFLARKPVVTTSDAGGPLEFVVDDLTGVIADPTEESVAGAIARLAEDRPLAKRLGDAGFDRARTITWDGVVERLVDQLRYPTTA